jgi:hypothetical protein
MAISRSLVSVSDRFRREDRSISVAEDAAEKLTLAATPKEPSKVSLAFPNGTKQIFGVD